MILPCPACQARFMVPDERITPRGIKIRCPKCRFVFIMKAQKRSVATPMEVPASAGAIAAPAPIKKKKKKKPPRERLPEAEAAKLTEDELAAMEEDEIVDMDDLAQPTEQSGTAYNPNVKEEHFQPVAQSAPSVMIDDSLLTAAAAHSASWTTAPVAADDLPRMSPSAAVSDTWIDLPGKETPTYPPLPAAPPPEPRGVVTSGSMGSTSGAIASGSMGSASGAIASGSMGSASGAIASGSMGSASGAIASGSMGSASGAIGAPAKPSPPPAPRATEEEVWPEPSLELELELEPEPEPELAEASAEAPASPDALPDTNDTIPGDVMSPFLAREASIPTAAALPVAGLAPTPRPVGAQGVLASVVPSPQTREEYESGGMQETFTPPAGSRFEMAYTLTAATTFTADELAELDEYEGLLVEERRALRKGHGATVILIVAICLGAGILGTLGYLGYQVLNPPKKQPPSWGHLQLSRNEHSLVIRKDRSSVVVATVTVKNASTKHKFRNVNVEAKLVSTSGELKCRSVAPCGPRLSNEELEGLTEGEYPKVLKAKSRVTAFNVQLNPSQEERCQIVLFCGAGYSEEQDRVQLQVDKELSERVIE